MEKRVALVLILTVVLSACSSDILKKIADENPESTITINKLEGESAKLFLLGVKEFCEVNEEEFYRVQVVQSSSIITKVISISGKLLCEVDTGNPEFLEKSIAVLVNKEPVYLKDVQLAINSIPEEQRAQSVPNIVNNMVDQELLVQEARNRGISVTNAEVEQALQSQVELAQLQEDDLDRVKKIVETQITVNKIVSQVLEDAGPQVKDSETKSYYEANKQSLAVPELWNIRHIKLDSGQRNEDQNLARAKTVYDLLNNSDFCDLVSQFSDDTESIGNCGRDSYSKGQVLPEIESEIQAMEVGEVRIIQSASYHILELEGKSPERQATYEEAKEQLTGLLLLQKRQKVLQEYIAKLREDAEIVSYLG